MSRVNSTHRSHVNVQHVEAGGTPRLHMIDELAHPPARLLDLTWCLQVDPMACAGASENQSVLRSFLSGQTLQCIPVLENRLIYCRPTFDHALPCPNDLVVGG